MKEIFEAIQSRISNPLLGYFTLVFLAVNWEVIFYLLVDEQGALERIAYFKSNTDIHTLITLPATFAIIISIAYPWINYLSLMLCRKPTELKSMFNAELQHKLLIKQQEQQALRAIMLADTERELIDRAKRDEELEAIKSEKIRDKLKKEVSGLRKERDKIKQRNALTALTGSALESLSGDSNSNEARSLMKKATAKRRKAIESNDNLKLAGDAFPLEEKAYELLIKSTNRKELLDFSSLFRLHASMPKENHNEAELIEFSINLEARAYRVQMD